MLHIPTSEVETFGRVGGDFDEMGVLKVAVAAKIVHHRDPSTLLLLLLLLVLVLVVVFWWWLHPNFGSLWTSLVSISSKSSFHSLSTKFLQEGDWSLRERRYTSSICLH